MLEMSEERADQALVISVLRFPLNLADSDPYSGIGQCSVACAPHRPIPGSVVGCGTHRLDHCAASADITARNRSESGPFRSRLGAMFVAVSTKPVRKRPA